MLLRAVKWLINLILSSLVLWGLSIGGGLILSALAAGLSGLEQPWVSLLALGVFLLSVAAIVGAIRVAISLLSPKARRAVGSKPPRALPPLPFTTPQRQLTRLIEEGRSWQRTIPAAATTSQDQLVQMLAGTNIDYPARMYEWEMRAWRLVSTPALTQWRGLFPEPVRAHPLAGLKDHVSERTAQLELILSKL